MGVPFCVGRERLHPVISMWIKAGDGGAVRGAGALPNKKWAQAPGHIKNTGVLCKIQEKQERDGAAVQKNWKIVLLVLFLQRKG